MRRVFRLGALVLIGYLAGCLLCGVLLAQFALHSPREAVSDALGLAVAQQHGARLRQVEIAAADGVRLRAWHLRPQRWNRTTVILLHGVGDTREGMLGFVEMFVRRGYAALLPDSRAHGQSGGVITTYGIKEADDVHRWVDWIVREEAPSCVYGMAESMGAAVLLQAAAAEPRICAVVAESPFATFREIAYDRVGQALNTGPWIGRTVLRPIVEFGMVYARLGYGLNMNDASPEKAIAALDIPVLLIHGLGDDNIPPRHSHRLRDRNPAHVTLWEVPRALHTGAMSTDPSEFERRVIGLFDSTTGKAEHTP